jgi:hypothetical protein
MVKRWWEAVELDILSLDNKIGRSFGVVEVGIFEGEGPSLSRLIRSSVILPCFTRWEVAHSYQMSQQSHNIQRNRR